MSGGTLGDAEKGVEDYDEVIRLQPESADAHLQRGMAKATLAQLEDAQVDLTRAVALARETGNEGVAADAEEVLETIEKMLEIVGELKGAVDGRLQLHPLRLDAVAAPAYRRTAPGARACGSRAGAITRSPSSLA